MVRVLLSSGFYVVQSRIALPPTFGIIQLVESVVNWFSKKYFAKCSVYLYYTTLHLIWQRCMGKCHQMWYNIYKAFFERTLP